MDVIAMWEKLEAVMASQLMRLGGSEASTPPTLMRALGVGLEHETEAPAQRVAREAVGAVPFVLVVITGSQVCIVRTAGFWRVPSGNSGRFRVAKEPNQPAAYKHCMPDPTDYLLFVCGNFIGAALFILGVGTIPEPWRQRAMVLLMGVAAVVYFGGGLGPWEYVFAVAIGVCAVVGVFDYRAIGVGWLLHTVSDGLHHVAGLPLLGSMALSSFGCAVFDPLIAVWFFARAPSTREVLSLFRRRQPVL